MGAKLKKHPLELLREIEERFAGASIGLPQQIEAKEFWSGIGFRLGSANFVAPLGEVTEILTYPSFTPVPMTRSWIKGIANVRGNLLPIMDLQGMISGHQVVVTPRTRVLAVGSRGVQAGLVVEEVFGLRHFFDEERTSILPSVDERIRPYLSRAYWRESEYWGVFSMHKLIDSDAFMQVAV